jgi:hypothetical protein
VLCKIKLILAIPNCQFNGEKINNKLINYKLAIKQRMDYQQKDTGCLLSRIKRFCLAAKPLGHLANTSMT